ncbi:MAG: hypothetical protein ACI9BH_001245 [Paracoccaceae bacterium]
MGRVDHKHVGFFTLAGQLHKDAREDSFAAPADPSVVKRLRGAAFHGRISPPQPIAIDEYYSTQNAPIINTGLAM